MSKELFEQRKSQFIETIKREKRLPRVWEFKFQDGEDQRLWFDKISKLEQIKGFVDEINNEINNVLKQCNIKLLTDKEKEEEFLNCIKNINKIPSKSECYFTDNSDMYMWYINYKKNNNEFETKVHNSLKEYQEFDIATIWPDIKQEFIAIIKSLKRIPNHGEVILQNGIDVRVIYDKLVTFDPIFIEKLLLHLQTYNKKTLTIEQRKEELINVVSTLGYIPFLQESRFSDGTDMFTWYTRYKKSIPDLEDEILSLVKINNPKNQVNVYIIPQFRKTGGAFYMIATNEGVQLDLTGVTSFEEAQELYPNLKKGGGLILPRGSEIGSVTYVKGRRIK